MVTKKSKYKKNSFIVCFILVIFSYLIYVNNVYKPTNFNHLSLIDDAITLVKTNTLYRECLDVNYCKPYIDQIIESGSNRFRPVYWITNNYLQEFFSTNAIAHHSFRIYFVGLLMVFLLCVHLYMLDLSPPFIYLGALIFFVNYSFSENIIRLGTNEPYQIIFLSLSSIIYLKFLNTKNLKTEMPKKIAVLILGTVLTLALLTKETSIAIIPAFVLHYFFVLKNKKANLVYYSFILPIVVLMLGIYLSKKAGSSLMSEFPDYTKNYLLDPASILINFKHVALNILNSTAPFIKVSFLMLLFMATNKRSKKYFLNKDVIFWFLFTLLFVLVLLPWKYTLERYQLIPVFGVSILAPFIFEKFVRYCKSLVSLNRIGVYLLNILIFVLISNAFFANFSLNLPKSINYSKWLSVFTRFEYEQISALSVVSDKVLINGKVSLNNLEILKSIPILVKTYFGVDFTVSLVDDGNLTNEVYVFNRSSFDNNLSNEYFKDSDIQTLANNSYHVDQIEVLAFKESFKLKPIQTVLNPPLKQEGYDYFWEIVNVKNEKY